MAKASSISREKKREILVQKYWARRHKYKTVRKQIRRGELPEKDFFLACINLDKLPKSSSPSRIRRRCWVTGRARGVYRDFGLSRHFLRDKAKKGLLPGLKKSSW
jgi:small subunit ribosomal protein S14